MRLELHWRDEDGIQLPMALWRPGPGHRMISSGIVGGGLGPREWVLNAQVPGGYARTDPVVHLAELTDGLALSGPGIGLLTAAQVTAVVQREDSGAHVAATVGLGVPTWAAAPPAPPERAQVSRPGTINLVVCVPVPLSDAAFVNAVVTVTEAKSQALLDAGFACTGTASDAVCVAAPAAKPAGPGGPGERGEDFAGPRSRWGARMARATHAAVYAGALDYARRAAAAGPS